MNERESDIERMQTIISVLNARVNKKHIDRDINVSINVLITPIFLTLIDELHFLKNKICNVSVNEKDTFTHESIDDDLNDFKPMYSRKRYRKKIPPYSRI